MGSRAPCPVTGVHYLKLGGPWDAAFEPLFNQIDNEISDFVQCRGTLET